MRTIAKLSLPVIVLALLTACGNRPFSELASAQQEALDFAMEQFNKQKNIDEYSDEAEDNKENEGDKWQELLDKLNEAAQNSIGTEVEAEATADAGVSIDGNFQVTNVTPGSDPTLTLKSSAEVADASIVSKLAFIGYDGSEPLLPLSSYAFYDSETNTLQFSFQCNSDDPEFAKRLGRITKIVITADRELYQEQKNLQRERKEELMRQFF